MEGLQPPQLRGLESSASSANSSPQEGQGLLSPVLLPGRGAPAGEAPLKYNRQCGSLAASCALDHGPDRTGTYTPGAQLGVPWSHL